MGKLLFTHVDHHLTTILHLPCLWWPRDGLVAMFELMLIIMILIFKILL